RVCVNLVPGECDGVAVQIELADLKRRNVEDDGRLVLAGARHGCVLLSYGRPRAGLQQARRQILFGNAKLASRAIPCRPWSRWSDATGPSRSSPSWRPPLHKGAAAWRWCEAPPALARRAWSKS